MQQRCPTYSARLYLGRGWVEGHSSDGVCVPSQPVRKRARAHFIHVSVSVLGPTSRESPTRTESNSTWIAAGWMPFKVALTPQGSQVPQSHPITNGRGQEEVISLRLLGCKR